jgi:hypothetical protein
MKREAWSMLTIRRIAEWKSRKAGGHGDERDKREERMRIKSELK